MRAPARTDKRPFTEWWRTVDQVLVLSVTGLAVFGVFVSVATSNATEIRGGPEAFYYFGRHILYTVAALGALILLSMRSVREVQGLATLLYVGALVAVLLTLLIGPEINGAQRWLRMGPLSVQPSEFLKPAFVVMAAWVLSEGNRLPGFPGRALALLLLAAPMFLFLLQPDVGQTVLLTAIWGALLFAAGLPWGWTIGLGVLAAMMLATAYMVFPHVASRIDMFVLGSQTGRSQVDYALEALRNGGLRGVGPGEGTVKSSVPDARTDFAFAVMGEELGLWTCMAVALLFLSIVARGLIRTLSERDHFVQLAAAGLFLLFGMQAFINMGVNLGLLPATGMTLPFISYGGSSLVATGVTLGFALALTRRRAGAVRRGTYGRI
ncbi:cell division protein FtsW [bacterium AH-315-P15]|nr:cell division protein FtsW [bacterium AH-315-P15]